MIDFSNDIITKEEIYKIYFVSVVNLIKKEMNN